MGATNSLSVVFIGTPEFAVPSLQALAASSHRVLCVVTTPDRRAGRGLKANPSPVSVVATSLGLSVVHVSPRDSGALARVLSDASPDVAAVVAWGGLLNSRSIGAPQVAALNVHGSLLPRYRGAAPIERALMAGETVTGVTVMYMAVELDAGDILAQQEVPVPEGADAGRMRAFLGTAGAGLLVRSIDQLATGEAGRTVQDSRLVSWAPKLTPEDERISWHTTASEIANRVRALSPNPGAHFVYRGQRVKVLEAGVLAPPQAQGGPKGSVNTGPDAAAGAVLGHKDDSLMVAAGGATIVLLSRVQPAGGRPVAGAAWANGRRLSAGMTLDQGGTDFVLRI